MAGLYDDEGANDGKTLKLSKDDEIIYSYAGFYTSYFYSFPYRHESYVCNGDSKQYDPRYRPWYVRNITNKITKKFNKKDNLNIF